MKKPDFSTWSHENLVKLAEEMYLELVNLRQDVKDAINAYREILTKEIKK